MTYQRNTEPLRLHLAPRINQTLNQTLSNIMDKPKQLILLNPISQTKTAPDIGHQTGGRAHCQPPQIDALYEKCGLGYTRESITIRPQVPRLCPSNRD